MLLRSGGGSHLAIGVFSGKQLHRSSGLAKNACCHQKRMVFPARQNVNNGSSGLWFYVCSRWLYRCVCSYKTYRTLLLMCHLQACEESIRKRACCIFSLMEYLAILQRSGEKVLQPCLTLKPITANSLSSQKLHWSIRCNANGCSKDCRKSPCCCLSCTIGLRADTSEPLTREAVHCSWRQSLMAKILSARCFSGPPYTMPPLSLPFGLCRCS